MPLTLLMLMPNVWVVATAIKQHRSIQLQPVLLTVICWSVGFFGISFICLMQVDLALSVIGHVPSKYYLIFRMMLCKTFDSLSLMIKLLIVPIRKGISLEIKSVESIKTDKPNINVMTKTVRLSAGETLVNIDINFSNGPRAPDYMCHFFPVQPQQQQQALWAKIPFFS